MKKTSQTKKMLIPGVSVGVVAAVAASAGASFSATITADNHYALYTSDGESIQYIGGNETTAAGSPGTYNWSMAETWTFPAAETIFIAAWSDDAVAQGLLAQIDIGGEMIYTGDPAWKVYSTGLNRGTGDPHPLTSEIASHVQFADLNGLWVDPYVGPNNSESTNPWKLIAGIDAEARWAWAPGDTPDVNTLIGPGNFGEYLIFRYDNPVPPPATASLMALAGIAFAGRRRKH